MDLERLKTKICELENDLLNGKKVDLEELKYLNNRYNEICYATVLEIILREI